MNVFYFIFVIFIVINFDAVAELPKCLKQNSCETASHKNSSEELYITCTLCKIWSCVNNGVIYKSYGCYTDWIGGECKFYSVAGVHFCNSTESATCDKNEYHFDYRGAKLVDKKCEYQKIYFPQKGGCWS